MWELTEKMLFQENWSCYERLMKPGHWKKNYCGHILTALKAFKTERELHHSLTTLNVFNSEKKDAIIVLKFLIPKKDFITCLGLLKFLTLRKSSITSLRLLKVLILNNHCQILITGKVYQNSYSLLCWWTVASQGCLSYHIYD